MFTRSPIARKGFEAWPWPSKLPLKAHWYRHYNHGPSQSISREVRGVQFVGDVSVCFVIVFVFWRNYTNWMNGNAKTRLRHTTGMPPAIIAQEFDFQNPESNRRVSRARLDEYRNEFAAGRTGLQCVEDMIFKY